MKENKNKPRSYLPNIKSNANDNKKPVNLDGLDCHILNLLQEDNRLSNVELAKRIGLSAPPCLRRVQRLQEAGIIQQNVAVLDPIKTGYELIAFVHVTLEKQREDLLESFERKMRAQEEVMQCYFISGDADYFLIVQVKSMNEYADFSRRILANELNIKMFRSSFSLKRVKYKTKLLMKYQAPF
jgi:Lrp/AsnC family leucine-responsive transcriptional regulator